MINDTLKCNSQLWRTSIHFSECCTVHITFTDTENNKNTTHSYTRSRLSHTDTHTYRISCICIID